MACVPLNGDWGRIVGWRLGLKLILACGLDLDGLLMHYQRDICEALGYPFVQVEELVVVSKKQCLVCSLYHYDMMECEGSGSLLIPLRYASYRFDTFIPCDAAEKQAHGAEKHGGLSLPACISTRTVVTLRLTYALAEGKHLELTWHEPRIFYHSTSHERNAISPSHRLTSRGPLYISISIAYKRK